MDNRKPLLTQGKGSEGISMMILILNSWLSAIVLSVPTTGLNPFNNQDNFLRLYFSYKFFLCSRVIVIKEAF